jgi:type I restriction enzyme S subunit
MDSLGYFKNQVFSEDLSTYKVIRRGEIGYPANHVEEGSIGLQDLYDAALVSPIYVVFGVNEDVSSFFLHRLLKLDCYRQQFKTATMSSVDRRGSLRWPAFSELNVKLPRTKSEQIAIGAVLADMERELAILEARRDKTRNLKQAMMQELLTGKTRLVPAGGAHA